MDALAAGRRAEDHLRAHLLQKVPAGGSRPTGGTMAPEDVVALGPEGAVDYFTENPEAVEPFFAAATPEEQALLLEGINEMQASGEVSEEQLRTMDQLWVQGMESGAPGLQPALDTYIQRNVDRPGFVEAAFIEDLRAGRTDEAFRSRLHRSFAALDMDGSHTVMEAIRQEGLLDPFLHATLRDADGNPVDPRIHDGMREMMETGRLDIYAETLASTSFNVHDPDTSGRAPHPAAFYPGEDAIYFTEDKLGRTDSEGIAKTLAHEIFHAFQHDHGGTSGALNEGFGVAASNYAFTDDDYSLAEMVYGTKNWKRDQNGDADYPLGSYENADPKLTELLEALSGRDRSQLAWRDPDQLEQEYEDFWEPYDRFEDADGDGEADWSQPGGSAETAEAQMLAAREAEDHRTP